MSYESVAAGILTELRSLFPTPSGLPSDIAVYDGDVPGRPTNRYLILFAGAGLRQSSTVDGSSRDLWNSFQVTTVAANPEAASTVTPMTRALQQRVRDKLTDLKLDVAGLVCGPIVHQSSQIPVVDEDVADRNVVFAVDEFTVLADRL